MNKHNKFNWISSSRQAGFSILEVLIGIFIFVVGLLALSALQGALTRSMADAKLRTTAVNIAELTIESNRGFTILLTDPDGILFAYNDIVDVPNADDDGIRTVNGVNYTVVMDVSDFYFHPNAENGTFTEISTGANHSDYKTVEVTVSWDAVRDFRGDEGAEISAASLGTGNVQLTSTISSLITSASARVADETESNSIAPVVTYSPGARPEIVSLSLGDSKFKESLTPEPIVLVRDELVETRFDVVTYSQNNAGSQFLRREEFASVACECELHNANAANPGRRPVVWAGDEYKGGHFVEKAYGTSANNQQSSLCDSCCRDHHDGGTAPDSQDHATDAYYNVVAPFKGDGEYLSNARTSDHLHYGNDGITPASNGDHYHESCRLVRVDGFFRVAQDFRREDQYVFPPDFLDDADEIDTYSSQVTNSASLFTGAAGNGYPSADPQVCIGNNGPTCLANPTLFSASPGWQGDPPTAIGADELPSWTALQTAADTKQLRSRGIYIDYLSNDLRAVLTCLDAGGDADTCQTGDVILDRTGSVNTLELLPFFEVQLTKLNRWNERPRSNSPVDTTNEPLADGNTHDRGRISMDADGSSNVVAKSHRGNIGFTDTPAIEPAEIYNAYVTTAELNVQAGSGGPVIPPPNQLPVVGGSLTSSIPGNVPIIVGPGVGGAICEQTGANWSCSVPVAALAAYVTIRGYGKINRFRYACSDDLTIVDQFTSNATAYTTFNLSGVAPGDTYTINIQEGVACSP